MPGKFVIRKGSSGQFHFNLVGANGEIVATSETYAQDACRTASRRFGDWQRMQSSRTRASPD
jgi:hypothetical protein